LYTTFIRQHSLILRRRTDNSLNFPDSVIAQRRDSTGSADGKGYFRTPGMLRFFRRPDKFPDRREPASGVKKGNGMRDGGGYTR
jgi:hypothetical protein